MKAIGIDAFKLNEDLNIINKESTLIKALINSNGELVYEDIINFDTREKIEQYNELQDFLDIVLQTAKTEFGTNFNVFNISGIDDNDDYLWTIRCTIDDEIFIYTFTSPSDEKFIETLVKNIDNTTKKTEDAVGNVIFRDNFGTSKDIITTNGRYTISKDKTS